MTEQPANEEERRRACIIALNNQSVLKRGRQVFSYDNTGHPQYIADGDRACAQTHAERSEAKNCN